MQTWQESWDAIADKDDWSLETKGEDPHDYGGVKGSFSTNIKCLVALRGQNRNHSKLLREGQRLEIGKSRCHLSMASVSRIPEKPYPIKIRIHGSDREDLLTQVGEWWHNTDPAFRAGKWCFGLEKQEILQLAYKQKAFGAKGYVPIDVSSALASVSTGLPVGLVYPHQESHVPILLQSDSAGHDTSTLEEAIVFRQGGGYSLADDITKFHSAQQLTSHHSINGRPCLYLVATDGSAADERDLEMTLKGQFSNLQVEALGASSTQKAALLRVQSCLPYCAFFAALSVFSLLRRIKAFASNSGCSHSNCNWIYACPICKQSIMGAYGMVGHHNCSRFDVKPSCLNGDKVAFHITKQIPN